MIAVTVVVAAVAVNVVVVAVVEVVVVGGFSYPTMDFFIFG